MKQDPRVDQVSDSFESLVEAHLYRLREKLRSASLPELAEEVHSLDELLESYRQRDELLERLLDSSITEGGRQQILETLRALRIKVSENRSEMARLLDNSHKIRKQSAQLILVAQRRIDKDAHRDSGYALELCGFCSGLGGASNDPCPACRGVRTVLVHQPAIKCPRCGGNGQPENWPSAINKVCSICRGFGWVMTVEKRSDIPANKEKEKHDSKSV